MEDVKIEVKFSLRHIELFDSYYFDIHVAAKFKGYMFKMKIDETVYYRKHDMNFSEFIEKSINFINDEERVKAYAVSMVEEEIGKMSQNDKDKRDEKILRDLIRGNKITFTQKMKGLN